jgi:lysophospholipase II
MYLCVGVVSSCSMTHVASGQGSTCTVSPVLGVYTAAMIFIHGLGGSCEHMQDKALELGKELPHVKFVMPSATNMRTVFSLGRSIPSWYHIFGRTEWLNRYSPGIEASRTLIDTLIKEEIDQHNIPASRIVVGGFSQGAALSLYTGLQWSGSSEPLGAAVCLSGYLPATSVFKMTDQGRQTPIFHAHGSRDSLVTLEMARMTKAEIERHSHGGRYQFNVYPDMDHSIQEEATRDLIAFLKDVLPAILANSQGDASGASSAYSAGLAALLTWVYLLLWDC